MYYVIKFSFSHAQNILNMKHFTQINHFVTYSCCTSSSCEFWPHSGTNPFKYPSLDEKSFASGSHNKANVNDSDSSGHNVKVSVNSQKQKQQVFRSTTVTVNGGQVPAAIKHVNKPHNNSIIFLGDCEMPITKSAATRKNSGSDTSANKAKEDNSQKIQITSRHNGEVKQLLAASGQQARWVVLSSLSWHKYFFLFPCFLLGVIYELFVWKFNWFLIRSVRKRSKQFSYLLFGSVIIKRQQRKRAHYRH